MVNNTTVSPSTLDGDYDSPLNSILLVITVVGMAANFASILVKIFLKFAMPNTWKMSCLLLDVSHFTLGLGLGLVLCFIRFGSRDLCNASGFFLMVGVLDCLCVYLVSNVIVLFVQYPEKLSGYSHYPKWTIPAMLVPEKTITFLLSLCPFLPISYFTNVTSPYPVACLPVRGREVEGAGYGAALMMFSWLVMGVAVIVCLVTSFRLWKSGGGRIHASSPNIWQLMMLSQGRTYQRFLLFEQLVWLVVLFITTVIVYTNSTHLLPPQWIVLLALATTVLLHGVLSNVVTVLWSTLCCRTKQQAKEPFQKLKKLELIKIDAPGKYRMKATWSGGRGVYKRGLLKVYGVDHLKAWAQEIVILGMMRKAQSPSLLQCLWTNSGNPYFETMTLITGEIIPSESRLICFELTNSGTLGEFLSKLDMPLPEPCQRTLIHDIAEGLACLHHHNILHHKLTSACVHLKGSVQCMVLRAALGDFEEAQIYGSLQGGSSSSALVSKKHFFLPDIRAFALVALEIISFVCKKRQEARQPFRKTRSEVILSPHKEEQRHGGKARDRFLEKAHRSRSLDEKAILEDDIDSDMPYVGSVISVREADTGQGHRVTESGQGQMMTVNDRRGKRGNKSEQWGQPVTSVTINTKESASYSVENDARQTYKTRLRSPRTNNSQCDRVTHVVPYSGFKADAPQFDNDYDEIEEITEDIQRTQATMQTVRYPNRDVHPTRNSPSEGNFSAPVEMPLHRVVGNPVAPRVHQSIGGSFQRSDPLRQSASSVSTLEDIQEEIPAEEGGSMNPTLKDLWLKKESVKKEKLMQSYNERMRKELKDVFSRKGRKGKGMTKEIVHELSRPMSARESYSNENVTFVVPYEEAARRVNARRPQTAGVPLRQGQPPRSTKRHPAPPPPSRPSTAGESVISRPETATGARPQTATGARPQTAKKTQARAKLKKALAQNARRNGRDMRGQGAAVVETKYATVKKIPQIQEQYNTNGKLQIQEVKSVTEPLRETPQNCVGQFSSFSSNDSLGSSFYRQSTRKGDVSLTSGELTSLSSQAETLVPCDDTVEVIEIPPGDEGGKARVRTGKMIDSGFDSASITSEVSGEVSPGDGRSCSCPSGSYTTDTCSTCQCSISPTAGMHTKALYPSKGSWKSDSFSSYDSTDIDQKLDRLRKGEGISKPDVIGPDEQYPMAKPTKPLKPMNIKHGKVVSKTLHTRKGEFGSATKRYKELRKKGVPMRVSVVSSASSQEASDVTDWESYMESTAEVIEEEDDNVNDDNGEDIFSALDSQGFFEPESGGGSVYNKPVAVVHGTKRRHKVDRTNSMILDDIIRELPDELTGVSSIEDETQSFLHHSQDSFKGGEVEEEIVDMEIEMPYEQSSVVDAELVIDRLFTKRNTLKHKGSLQDVMDPILGFDESLIRELAGPQGGAIADQRSALRAQMMKGVTETHVRSCKELSAKNPLVSMSELFPATNNQFRVLRNKLEKVGNFGNIGKQLLDTVQLCWVSDSPPSASELVNRLLDSVTETEL